MIEAEELTTNKLEKEIKFIDLISAVHFYKEARKKIKKEFALRTEKQHLSNKPDDVVELYFALPEEIRLCMMIKDLERREYNAK